MRKRATVAILSGVLAISTLAAPAALADQHIGDTKITKVVVNGGQPIVLGTANPKKVVISVTGSDPKGINDGIAFLWHGNSVDSADGFAGPTAEHGTCKKLSSTSSSCSVSITIDPKSDLYANTLAGYWKVFAGAQGKDSDFITKDAYTSVKVQRAAGLTVNASPEPVAKNGTITVTGRFTRADWQTHGYSPFGGQSVRLQFKKTGTSTWTTVKWVKSTSTGYLTTTAKATADGNWRYSFDGVSSTPAVASTPDWVDVK
ncbi:calcium-binding protein [Streptomyces sp. NPDC046977]|uniref:calcium-binding protein n=1 Tax=Streptomyces sp. NPDC046977 TaxID=3154703 RepID=UPI0033F3DB3D